MEVKIKTWEAMVDEFGTDNFENILCENIFTKDMENALPEDRIIEVESAGNFYRWYPRIPSYPADAFYTISNDMIEKNIENF